jgi:hypothetical protein
MIGAGMPFAAAAVARGRPGRQKGRPLLSPWRVSGAASAPRGEEVHIDRCVALWRGAKQGAAVRCCVLLMCGDVRSVFIIA